MRVEPKAGQYVSVFCEDPDLPFPTGWRRVVVIAAGRRWVRLIEPATLTTAKVTRAQFDEMAPRPVQTARLTSIARRIRARRDLYRRLEGVRVPEGWVKQALAVLARRPEARR